MNNNSLICKYIKEFPNTWAHNLKEKSINIKNEDNYYIFNYDVGADFSDPLVQECRGIIINKNLDVVCWPFRKFGNYTESYADDIDWNTARVQEKLDGSILKLWYDNEWHWSTNGQITIDDNFSKILKTCANYNLLNCNTLDKNVTYIFELTSPDNQIVIKYPYAKLYYIGSRVNQTGEELNIDIGIEKPKEYPLQSLENCIIAIKKLNTGTNVEHEGFVVVDDNWHRVKIKTPEYFMWHRLINNHSFKKEYFLDLIINKPELIEEFCLNFPKYEHVMKYYQWQYSEFLYKVDTFVEYAKNVYAENSYERKALANVIKDNKYSSIAFSCIDKNISANEFIKQQSIKKIIRFVKEYSDE